MQGLDKAISSSVRKEYVGRLGLLAHSRLCFPEAPRPWKECGRNLSAGLGIWSYCFSQCDPEQATSPCFCLPGGKYLPCPQQRRKKCLCCPRVFCVLYTWRVTYGNCRVMSQ